MSSHDTWIEKTGVINSYPFFDHDIAGFLGHWSIIAHCVCLRLRPVCLPCLWPPSSTKCCRSTVERRDVRSQQLQEIPSKGSENTSRTKCFWLHMSLHKAMNVQVGNQRWFYSSFATLMKWGLIQVISQELLALQTTAKNCTAHIMISLVREVLFGSSKMQSVASGDMSYLLPLATFEWTFLSIWVELWWIWFLWILGFPFPATDFQYKGQRSTWPIWNHWWVLYSWCHGVTKACSHNFISCTLPVQIKFWQHSTGEFMVSPRRIPVKWKKAMVGFRRGSCQKHWSHRRGQALKISSASFNASLLLQSWWSKVGKFNQLQPIATTFCCHWHLPAILLDAMVHFEKLDPELEALDLQNQELGKKGAQRPLIWVLLRKNPSFAT